MATIEVLAEIVTVVAVVERASARILLVEALTALAVPASTPLTPPGFQSRSDILAPVHHEHAIIGKPTARIRGQLADGDRQIVGCIVLGAALLASDASTAPLLVPEIADLMVALSILLAWMRFTGAVISIVAPRSVPRRMLEGAAISAQAPYAELLNGSALDLMNPGEATWTRHKRFLKR